MVIGMPVKTMQIKTTGMHCPSCSMLIEMNVAEIDGVKDVTVDLAKGITDVTFDDDDVDVHAIVAEIEKSGYGVEGDV